MEIIYKDTEIAVCVKPSGVLSAKDDSGKANMMDMLCDELSLSAVYPIHRLDREVSGIIVFALSSAAAAKLSADAADHLRFKKEYLAIVNGIPESDSGVFEDLLFKDSSKNKSFVVKKMRRGVKQAKLEYSVVEKLDNKALVRVRLLTGRTHQIRIQFSSRKMSILGDRKYGGGEREGGIALYSVLLEFYHPKTKEKLKFEYMPQI